MKKKVPVVRVVRPDVAALLPGMPTETTIALASIAETVKARPVSKYAVSRRFITATETAMAQLLSRDLSKLDVAVLMIDRVHFADDVLVVAMIVTADGTKIPVGLAHGDAENSTVVKRLLAISSLVACASRPGCWSCSTVPKRSARP